MRISTLLTACLLLALAMPTTMAVVSYGGTDVEVPVNIVGTAQGDSSVVVNSPSPAGVNFGTHLTGGWPALPVSRGPNAGLTPTSNFAHAWVFTGTRLAANTVGGAYAEWSGHKIATASDVEVGTANAGVYTMTAQVDGQAMSQVLQNRAGTGADPTGLQEAQSLIDAWAGRGTFNGNDAVFGNAQITSAVQNQGDGIADAGTTQRPTVGNPQGEATASFAADRAINWAGTTQIPGRIIGTVHGRTNVETVNERPLATGTNPANNGIARGISQIQASAGADVGDTGFQSWTDTRIWSASYAQRIAGSPALTLTSSAHALATGDASAQAWDSESQWSQPKTGGSESAASSASGRTEAIADTFVTGDRAFGTLLGAGEAATAGGLAGFWPAGGAPVTAQIWAASGKDVNVFQGPIIRYSREAFAGTATTARVLRTTGNRADHDSAETFITNGEANSYARDANLMDQRVTADVSNVQQSSGGHAQSFGATAAGLPGQGSDAAMSVRALFNPNLAAGFRNQVELGATPYIALAVPLGSSGLLTNGPAWTTRRWDDAGSYLIADSQSAVSTSSAGTFSETMGPVLIAEWVAGNDPLRNMNIATAPSITASVPVYGTIVPTTYPTQIARNPDYTGWNGLARGDE